jgi:hypothetical protein
MVIVRAREDGEVVGLFVDLSTIIEPNIIELCSSRSHDRTALAPMSANTDADLTTKGGTGGTFLNVRQQNEVVKLIAETVNFHEKFVGALLFGCCPFHCSV